MRRLFLIHSLLSALAAFCADGPEMRWAKVISTDQAASTALLQVRTTAEPSTGGSPASPERIRLAPGDARIGYVGRDITFQLVRDPQGPRADKVMPYDKEALRQVAEVSDALHRETLDKGRLVTRMPNDLMPNMALWDQDGRLVTKRDFLGTTLALNFIFTSCRSARMCPASTACMKQLGELMAKQSKASKILLLTITFDPETDTPGVLRAYADGYGIDHARHRFLTGDPAQIKDLMRHYGILTLRDDGTIVHNAALVLISAEGRILQRRDGASFDAEDVAKVLTQAAR